MDAVVIETAAHTAYLRPDTGDGLLALPDPARDMLDPTPPGVHVEGVDGAAVPCMSMHEADYGAIMSILARMGWTLSVDDDGGEVVEGVAADGRIVVGLFDADPTMADPPLDAMAGALADLRVMAGL